MAALDSNARRYYRQMRAGYDDILGRYAQPSQAGNPGLQRFLSEVDSAPRASSAAPNSTPRNAQPTNPATHLLDWLTQAQYAANQTALEGTALINRGRNTGDVGDIVHGYAHELNPVEFFKNLGEGNRKRLASSPLSGDETFNEEFQKAGGADLTGTPGFGATGRSDTDNAVQKVGKIAGNFAVDVAADPLTYVTGGAIGAGIKALGTAGRTGAAKAGIRSAETVASGVEKTGEAITKADDFINSLPGRAIDKVKAKRAARNEVINLDEIVTPAPAPVAQIASEPSELATQVNKNAATEDFIKQLVATSGDRAFKPLSIVERKPKRTMGLRGEGDQGLQYNARRAAQVEMKQALSDEAAAAVKGSSSSFPTPFKVAPVAKSNPKVIAQDAVKQAEVEAKTIQVEQAKLESKGPDDAITADEIKEWLSKHADVEIPRISGSPRSVRGVLDIAQGRVAGNKKQANADLVNAAKAGVRADRAAAVDAARGGLGDAPNDAMGALSPGLAALPAPPAARRGSKPSQARADASPAAAQPSIILRSPQEIGKIKKRWRANLEEEDFEYLWSKDYLDDPNMTPAQKSAEFVMRVAALRKMQPTDVPRYEVFYHRQYSVTRGRTKPEADSVSQLPQAKSPKSEAFNGALSRVTTADEILKQADNSVEASAERQAARIVTGAEMDAVDPNLRAMLQKVTSGRILRKDATGQQFKKPRKGYERTTPVEGTNRNAEVLGEGRGVNRFVWNSKTSANMFREILAAANKQIREDGATFVTRQGKPDGFARGRFLMEYAIPRIKAYEDFLRAHNIQPTAGLSQKNGLPLSLGDALETMAATREGRDFLTRRVFGGMFGINKKGATEKVAGTVYVDSLLRVLGSVVSKIDADAIKLADSNVDILEAIAKSVYATAKSGTWTEQTLKDALTEYGKLPITTARPTVKGRPEATTGGFPVDVNAEGAPIWGKNSQGVLNEFMHVLFSDPDFRLINALAQRVQLRAAAFGQQFGDTVRELTQETLDETLDFLKSNPSLKDSADLLNDTDALVKRGAQTKIIPPTREEVWAAQMRVKDDIKEVVSPSDQASIKAMAGVGRAESAKQANKSSIQVLDEQARIYDNEPMSAQKISVRDETIQDRTTVTRRAGIWVTNHFGAPMSVDNATGRPRLNPIYEPFAQRGSLNQNYSQALKSHLNKINRMGTRAELKFAYDYLRKGGTASVPPNIKAIADEFDKISSQFFDRAVNVAGESDGILPTFLGRGFDIRHVEDMLRSSRISMPEGAQFDWDAIASKLTPRDKAIEMQRQWRDELTIDDPIDYMGRLSAALSSINAEMSMAQGAYNKMLELGLASTKPREGYVQLTETATNNLTRYFPQEGTYYVDKDIIPELQKLNRLLTETTSFAPGTILNTLTKHYDPLLGMWKSGVTIWRLGHHVRNLVGDISLSFLADGVKNPRYYYSAMEMLGARAKYDSVDMLRILQDVPTDKVLGHAGRSFKVDLGNKAQEVTLDDIYDAMYTRGLIKDFSVQEDLIEATNTPQYIERFQNFFKEHGLRGRGREFVGTVSQARDDLVRIAHALHLLENPGLLKKNVRNFKNIDELYDEVAHRVNKSHPDGTGLTTTERKYARRLMPFYSWMRKSIPLVIEAALEHPGRITMFPKASYALAQQMGVEPDSLSDPFPNDQLFPHWLTDQVTGPIFQNSQGQYYGANPGEVSSDTLNTFLTGTTRECP